MLSAVSIPLVAYNSLQLNVAGNGKKNITPPLHLLFVSVVKRVFVI